MRLVALTTAFVLAWGCPWLLAQTVLHSIPGTAANQLFGTAVAAAGDVDADGFPDLLVGAAGDDSAGS